MQLWINPKKPEKVTPWFAPETTFVLFPMSTGQHARLNAALKKRRKVAALSEKDEDDPDLAYDIRLAEAEAFAKLVKTIEGFPGDDGPRTLTDSGEMARIFVDEMPVETWGWLVETFLKGVTRKLAGEKGEEVSE